MHILENAKFSLTSTRYEVSDEDYVRVLAHVEGRKTSAEHYKERRNASDPMKNIHDSLCGEVIASHALKEFGINVQPDFTIYAPQDKSFACDFAEQRIHVKATDQYFNGNPSWVFQRSDKNRSSGKDAVFKESEDELSLEYVMFVLLDETYQRSGKVVASARMDRVMPLLRDPRSPVLIGIKKCFYFSDLAKISH